MNDPSGGPDPATAGSGPPEDHTRCRAPEFARWTRVMLEHEREYLSKAMTGAAFMAEQEREMILHELADIDYFLRYLEVKVQLP